MTDLHWSPKEFEWVAQVRQVLLDLARACLGDSPVVPMHLAQQATPTAERARQLLEAARNRGLSEATWAQYPPLQWTEAVRLLFIEIAELYLSDRPTVPDNLSERALELASTAQDLIQTAQPVKTEEADDAIEISSASTTTDSGAMNPAVLNEAANHETDPRVLMGRLHRSLKREWADSPRDNVPEWQQLLTLLEVMQGLYDRI
ncbi:MAG: hypothetical protein EAZ61_05800 [Oscillatoriales cyanobacterium]|jgi:hypothetical protein|nr:MAG: hypothetical protein EAZ61_05800 [Oscillatoriales cyanobacterium]